MSNEYFTHFPDIIGPDNISVTNLCLRVDFFNNIKNNANLFEELQILDGERPEDIALMAYDDPTLFWIILWSNDITNVYTQWPLNSTQLSNFVSEKYGVGNEFNAHHYVSTSESDLGEGIIVNFGTPFSTAVSNFDYEDQLNEQKRKIKVLEPTYIQQVLQEFAKQF